MRLARQHTLIALAAAGIIAAGCGDRTPVPARAGPPAEQRGPALTSAEGSAPDPVEGRRLFLASGCIACHRIEGIPEASGAYGPPLTGIAGRETIAGAIPNTPANMKQWLLDPAGVKPDTAMPQPGLTEQEAGHLAAFLATLR